MTREEYCLEVLHGPRVSEKSSFVLKATNTVVIKVAKNTSKSEIKFSIRKLFKVDVKEINILIVKGKLKRHKQRIGRRSSWKKAYVTLKKGQNLDFSNKAKSIGVKE